MHDQVTLILISNKENTYLYYKKYRSIIEYIEYNTGGNS